MKNKLISLIFSLALCTTILASQEKPRAGKCQQVGQFLNYYKLMLEINYDGKYSWLKQTIKLDQADKLKQAIDFGFVSRNYKFDYGFIHETLMEYAITKNAIKIVDLLVKYGFNVNKKNVLGRTILYNAIESDNLEMVKHLVKIGASIEIKDANDITPIRCARKHDDIHNYFQDLKNQEEYQKKEEVKKYLIGPLADIILDYTQNYEKKETGCIIL